MRRKRKEIVALNGVELFIHSGELFDLLGPNGADKTTTTRILTARESSRRLIRWIERRYFILIVKIYPGSRTMHQTGMSNLGMRDVIAR